MIRHSNEFAAQIYHISHYHHIMEYLFELFFIHSDFILAPLLTNDFSSFPTESQNFPQHLNVGKLCAYHEKLE